MNYTEKLRDAMDKAYKDFTLKETMKSNERQTNTLDEALLRIRKVDLVSALPPHQQLDILTEVLDTEGTPYYITKAEDGWYLNIDGTFLIPVIVLPK